MKVMNGEGNYSGVRGQRMGFGGSLEDIREDIQYTHD